MLRSSIGSLMALAACGSTSALHAPTPATLGDVSFVVSGEQSLVVAGTGVMCFPEEAGFIVDAEDVEGSDAWQLRVGRDAPDGPRELVFVKTAAQSSDNAVYRVSVGDAVWRDARAPFSLDHSLARDGHASAIAIAGSIACPRDAVLGESGAAMMTLLAKETGATARDYCTRDFGRERVAGCVSVVMTREAVDLGRLRAALPRGWVAFIGTSQWLGDEQHDEQIELVVAPGESQWDILATSHTDAINYGLSTAGVVRRLRALDAEVPFDIEEASTDLLIAKLKGTPKDPAAFAQAVYDLCPDIVDQGVGELSELERILVTERQLYLWWD